MFKTHGSKVLQDKYLPQLATEKLGSFCLSEPASGSDAFVRASLLTGFNNPGAQNPCRENKRWVCAQRVKDVGGNSKVILKKSLMKTNAADASIFLIFANLDPSKGYKGITCFVAEKEWGVQIAKKEKKVIKSDNFSNRLARNPSVIHLSPPLGRSTYP